MKAPVLFFVKKKNWTFKMRKHRVVGRRIKKAYNLAREGIEPATSA